MAEEQRKDFPGIELNQKVILYAGRSYKGTYGVEATVPKGTKIPKTYAKYVKTECIL